MKPPAQPHALAPRGESWISDRPEAFALHPTTSAVQTNKNGSRSSGEALAAKDTARKVCMGIARASE